MNKRSGRKRIIIPLVVLALIWVGWEIYKFAGFCREMNEFVSDAGEFMDETSRYWKEYESKPAIFYERFSEACDNLLTVYAGHRDYPYCIPIWDNPVIPEIILLANPKSIKVWSADHISVDIAQFRDEEEMGFGISWIRETSGNSGNLFLGASAGYGDPVYSR